MQSPQFPGRISEGLISDGKSHGTGSAAALALSSITFIFKTSDWSGDVVDDIGWIPFAAFADSVQIPNDPDVRQSLDTESGSAAGMCSVFTEIPEDYVGIWPSRASYLSYFDWSFYNVIAQ
jgi:hypothetical protein